MSAAFKRHLELIQLIENNFEHIQQLETLKKMFELMIESQYSKDYPNEFSLKQNEIHKLYYICEITINSHYDEKLKHDEHYINNQITNNGLKPLTSFRDLYYGQLTH